VPASAATIYVQPGEIQREWCDTCLTTAVVTVRIYGLYGTTCSLIGTFRRCTRCDTDDQAGRQP
jgi:hypothetical protein